MIESNSAVAGCRVIHHCTVLLAASLLICSALVSSGCSRGDADLSARYPLARNVSLSLPLTNQTGRKLARAEIQVHGILAQSSSQYLVTSETRGEYRRFMDEGHNLTWIYSLTDVDRTATPKVSISMEVGLADELNEHPEADISRYLVIRGSEQIGNLAGEIGVDAEPDTRLAGLFARFAGWSKGARSGGVDPASSAMTDEQPENTGASVPPAASAVHEHRPPPPSLATPGEELDRLLEANPHSAVADAFVFAELARTSGIPARILIGLHPSGTGTYTFRDITAWPEVYVDQRWTAVDTERYAIAQSPSDYIALRMLDAGAAAIQYEASSYIVEAIGLSFSPGAATIAVRNPDS